jgi:hypothetical protein
MQELLPTQDALGEPLEQLTARDLFHAVLCSRPLPAEVQAAGQLPRPGMNGAST